jgi:parallel beta-helix repeat protein
VGRAGIASWISLLSIQACAAINPVRAAEAHPTHAYCAIAPAIPRVPADAKVFDGTPTADASAAIQKALDNLKVGEWLVFSPAVYRIGAPLVVRSTGVTLYGQGATLLSTNATRGGVTVQADDVAIYGFTLDQASQSRQSTPWAGGIAIYDERDGKVRRVRGTIIQKNVINHAAAAGIFVYAAEDFTVADNSVWRSLADGIHMTAGASNGRVIGNTVSQTGDDMIAVVSYAGSAAVRTASERYKDWSSLQNGMSKNIYIGANNVSDQYWGRGISIVGGSHITVENNVVSRCPVAAGIYLERESSYRTFGVHNVLVRGNDVSEIETAAPSYQPIAMPRPATGHGAIEIGSLQDADELSDATFRAAFSVSDVTIVDNKIQHARFAGIRGGVGALDTVSRVLVRGNALIDVGAPSIVEAHGGLDATTIRCIDNKLDGIRWPRRCSRASAPARQVAVEVGALLHCSDTGEVQLSRR